MIAAVKEAYTELKKSKAEVESSMVPLRQELNRTKEVYAKERMARLSAQQETAMLKDQIMRLEKINENIDRECKTIPALADSNEILKNDLATLRKRFKDEKTAMSKQIKLMETQARDVEAVKADVRALSLRLLDIASTGGQPGGAGQLAQSNNNSSSYSGAGANSSGANYSSNMVAMNMMQQQRMASEQQQLQQKLRYDNSSNVQYEYGFEGARGGGGGDDEYEDYGAEDGDDTGTASRGDDAASYDGDSFVDDGSHMMLAASVESLGSSNQVHVSPPRNSNKNLHQQQQQQSQNAGGRVAIKKKIKRNAVGSNGAGGRGGGQQQLNMMQQMPSESGNIYNSSGNAVSQHQYRSNSGNSGQHQHEGGMVQSFSLPRIH
eukprot:gene21760-27816_t